MTAAQLIIQCTKILHFFPFSLLTNYQHLELWIHRTKHWDTNCILHSYCICWPVRWQLICQLCLKEVVYLLFPPMDWRMLFLRCTLRKALDLFDFCVLFSFFSGILLSQRPDSPSLSNDVCFTLQQPSASDDANDIHSVLHTSFISLLSGSAPVGAA